MNIGVLGLGSIGSRHAKNLMALGHTVYGYDTDAAALGKFVATGGINLYNESHSAEEIDAMIIASPTKYHAEAIRELADQDVYILCEKPIGLTRLDLEMLQGLTLKHPIMMGNNLRFHPCVRTASEWHMEGSLGKPIWASFNCAQKNEKYTDGVISNWGAHEIDLALYFLGAADVVAASCQNETADIILNHNGVQSTIHLDYHTQPFYRETMIAYENGYIKLDLQHRTARVMHADKTLDTIGTVFTDTVNIDNDYVSEIINFVSTIGSEKRPWQGATGEDAVEVLKIIIEAKRLCGK